MESTIGLRKGRLLVPITKKVSSLSSTRNENLEDERGLADEGTNSTAKGKVEKPGRYAREGKRMSSGKGKRREALHSSGGGDCSFSSVTISARKGRRGIGRTASSRDTSTTPYAKQERERRTFSALRTWGEINHTKEEEGREIGVPITGGKGEVRRLPAGSEGLCL